MVGSHGDGAGGAAVRRQHRGAAALRQRLPGRGGAGRACASGRRPGSRRIGVAYIDTPEAAAALARRPARLAARAATARTAALHGGRRRGRASLPWLLGRDAERAFLATAREDLPGGAGVGDRSGCPPACGPTGTC